jgi:hypothetical protein
MPTLEFKGKQFIYSHHLSVPFRELRIDAERSLPGEGRQPSLDDNLIIHGDNLVSKSDQSRFRNDFANFGQAMFEVFL